MPTPTHNPPPRTRVFVEGRYRKLARDLPQTIFWCPKCKGHVRRRQGCEQCGGFGKLTRDSVQELVGWVLGKAFGTRDHKFHGAGREDMDVRMLGAGRPFVLELEHPRVLDVDLAALERTINERNAGRLEVLGLHWTEKERVRVLKEGKFAKRYEALLVLEGELDPARVEDLIGRRIVVAQQTPNRVVHRRADLIRERWIRVVSFEPLAGGRARIVLETEHGTYVKEAISGEEQRTNPSLAALLGIPCRCEELDVLAILDEEGRDEVVTPEPPRTLSFGSGIDLE